VLEQDGKKEIAKEGLLGLVIEGVDAREALHELKERKQHAKDKGLPPPLIVAPNVGQSPTQSVPPPQRQEEVSFTPKMEVPKQVTIQRTKDDQKIINGVSQIVEKMRKQSAKTGEVDHSFMMLTGVLDNLKKQQPLDFGKAVIDTYFEYKKFNLGGEFIDAFTSQNAEWIKLDKRLKDTHKLNLNNLAGVLTHEFKTILETEGRGPKTVLPPPPTDQPPPPTQTTLPPGQLPKPLFTPSTTVPTTTNPTSLPPPPLDVFPNPPKGVDIPSTTTSQPSAFQLQLQKQRDQLKKPPKLELPKDEGKTDVKKGPKT
jgi:hypothetical protein